MKHCLSGFASKSRISIKQQDYKTVLKLYEELREVIILADSFFIFPAFIFCTDRDDWRLLVWLRDCILSLWRLGDINICPHWDTALFLDVVNGNSAIRCSQRCCRISARNCSVAAWLVSTMLPGVKDQDSSRV
ncbi:hypothetical protein CEXT_469791 [Caerostris extrusa]|uniref:Uncharacterized protein n=1 Tax=Caerostris extrusa TaxID=172846 RepID=A0AAV4NJ81_CAEEX|nr:hypothetical protein CEXT_469791 [Caerostris extrusa]